MSLATPLLYSPSITAYPSLPVIFLLVIFKAFHLSLDQSICHSFTSDLTIFVSANIIFINYAKAIITISIQLSYYTYEFINTLNYNQQLM